MIRSSGRSIPSDDRRECDSIERTTLAWPKSPLGIEPPKRYAMTTRPTALMPGDGRLPAPTGRGTALSSSEDDFGNVSQRGRSTDTGALSHLRPRRGRARRTRGTHGPRRRFSSSILIDIHVIDEALNRAGIAASLREALELLDGPIIHAETARNELKAAWSNAVSRGPSSRSLRFLQAPREVGLLKRLSEQRSEPPPNCAPAWTRCSMLSGERNDPRSIGGEDPRRRPCASIRSSRRDLVVAVWRQMSTRTVGDESLLVDGRQRRPRIGDERIPIFWAKAGILVNELARPALFLNLRITGAHAAGPVGRTGLCVAAISHSNDPAWDALAGARLPQPGRDGLTDRAHGRRRGSSAAIRSAVIPVAGSIEHVSRGAQLGGGFRDRCRQALQQTDFAGA